ncbi:M24 family metallopeptidase [Candidatus Entotheonella palauensis]|uniref:M24 family metallopeptidase n=1 Tax=Candidatus Entotheonella palauensis TaxID=93172 RepID=UPI000B7F83C5|nr:M24 family metallopeptidase [Candidatus Entotheonella palauensis]
MHMPQTLTLANDDKAQPVFSETEMHARLDTLRQHMAQHDIDAAVFTSIHNVNYFSGFLYCSFGRPYGLVVTHDQAVPVAANIDGGRAHRQSAGTGHLLYTDWQRDNFFVAVQSLVGNRVNVGIEFDHLNLAAWRKLQDGLPHATWVDIGEATMHMRLIKSAEEIALIRHGARIADIGGEACVEAVGEGVPEYVVASHATQAMIRAIAETYPQVELMDTWTWFQSGLNTDGAHNPVTSRAIQKGDILSLNCFPMIAGYYHALERTLFYASASDRALALWEINCQVHRRGLELIRPGARCCDIAAELNAIYQDHDLLAYRTFGYGHSFGVLCHYYGREAALELREDVETVLQPGMVVSMEPMIMIPAGQPGAGGYREHDMLVLTEDGAEDITQFPFGPAHNMIAG